MYVRTDSVKYKVYVRIDDKMCACKQGVYEEGPGGLRSYFVPDVAISCVPSTAGPDLDANRCAPMKSTKALTLGDK